MTSASPTTIHFLPPELLQRIFAFALLPTIPSSASRNGSDTDKLAQQEELFFLHTNYKLVCKFWRDALGPQSRFVAIGKAWLVRLLNAIEDGAVDGTEVRELELECYTELEHNEGITGEEDAERANLLAEVVGKCSNVEKLGLYFYDGPNGQKLVDNLQKMERLRELEVVNDRDLGLLIRILSVIPKLDHLHIRKMAEPDPLSSRWNTSILTSLTLSVVFFPADKQLFQDLLSTSSNTLRSLTIMDGRFSFPSAYATFDEIVAPFASRLHHFSCTHILNFPITPTNFGKVDKLLNPTLNRFISLQTLALHTQTFTSFDFLSKMSHLHHLALEMDLSEKTASSWTLKSLVNALESLQRDHRVVVEVQVEGNNENISIMFANETEEAEVAFVDLGVEWKNIELWVCWMSFEEDEIYEFARDKLFCAPAEVVEEVEEEREERWRKS